MLQETEQSPAVVAKLLEKEAGTFAEIARIFRKNDPAVITTAARGSSDHAATFFKYLIEIATGVPVASIGPSIASVYGSRLKLKNGLHFTVSQSGASPDIIAAQEAAKRVGRRRLPLSMSWKARLPGMPILFWRSMRARKKRRRYQILHRIGCRTFRCCGSKQRRCGFARRA